MSSNKLWNTKHRVTDYFFKSRFIKLASKVIQRKIHLFFYIYSSLVVVDIVMAWHALRNVNFEKGIDSTSWWVMCFCRISHSGTEKMEKCKKKNI